MHENIQENKQNSSFDTEPGGQCKDWHDNHDRRNAHCNDQAGFQRSVRKKFKTGQHISAGCGDQKRPDTGRDRIEQ